MSQLDDATVERSLDFSIKDGTAYAVMVGLGEAYLGVCAVFMKASPAQVALLGSIPPFLGALAQPLSANLVDRFGRRRPIYMIGAITQTLTWLMMIASIFLAPPRGFSLLMAGTILYFISIHFCLPAWNSTMGDLVPPEGRGKYFGRRSNVAIFCQWLGTILGGVGLDIYTRSGHEALGYVVIFSGAFLARCVSVRALARMAEPVYTPQEKDKFTMWQFLRQLPRSNFTKFVFFVAALNLSANFAGALFVPYMKNDLQMEYWQFMIAQAIIVIAQMLTFRLWGSIGDRFGNKKVLVATSIIILTLPLWWMVSRSIWWAWWAQALAGIGWSGFNMCAANFLFDSVVPAKRARCTAYFNVVVGFGLLVGGLLGAALSGFATADYVVFGRAIHLAFAFHTLLIVSFLLRLLTLVIFVRRFREVREVPDVGYAEIFFGTARLRSIAEAAVGVMTFTRKKNGRPAKELVSKDKV